MLTELLVAVAFSTQPVLKPRTDAQVAAFLSTDPELLYSGRKAGGKSWLIVAKTWAYCEAYPGAKCMVARAERASMDNTTLDVAREVIPSHIWAACWREGKSRLDLGYCGSFIDFRGLDDPERIQGSRYGFVGIDQGEQLSFRQFELANSCAGQRGMPWHQLMLAVNPETPDHWIYRRYHPDRGDGLREVTSEKIPARVVRVAREDLWDLMPAAYKARLSSLSGVRRRQLVDGEWCAHEAQVYGRAWDAATMAHQPRPDAWVKWGSFPPPDWDRVRSIDFGFDHAAVCLWCALEPGSDRLWLYRQHYQSGLSPRQNALAIKELERIELATLRESCPDDRAAREMEAYLQKLNLVESWSDHDRGERETYAEEGIWSEAADKEILAGIGSVADAMMEGKIVTVEGNLAERDQRLGGMELPTCLEEEIPQYHRPGGDEEGIGRKELPVKEHDHALDALRYVVQSRKNAVRPGVYA